MKPSESWSEADYPPLYRAADQFAIRQQRGYFRLLAAQLTLLVSSSFLSIIASFSSPLAVAQAVLLGIALALAVYLHVIKPEQTWYGARALAESMKTLTWRFVMRADPFEGADDHARELFCKRLHEVITHNRYHMHISASGESGPQITKKMTAVRGMDAGKRLELYLSDRVENQRVWYSFKTLEKKKGGQLLFGLLAFSMVVSIIFACLRIAFADAPLIPTDAFATLSTSLLAWAQANRYSELVASYGLTAHEIGIVESSVPVSIDDGILADFVKETENAFSREHTQWVARKDI